MKYYIAYGSNTPQEMKYRCPHSEFLGKAVLSGHRLVFKAFATIEECHAGVVEVMLYSISDRDEHQLDIYEGFPEYYDKKTVSVIWEDKVIEAIVYYIPEGSRQYYLTSLDYFYRCVVGYVQAKIPIEQLTKAFCYTLKKQIEVEQS